MRATKQARKAQQAAIKRIDQRKADAKKTLPAEMRRMPIAEYVAKLMADCSPAHRAIRASKAKGKLTQPRSMSSVEKRLAAIGLAEGVPAIDVARAIKHGRRVAEVQDERTTSPVKVILP